MQVFFTKKPRFFMAGLFFSRMRIRLVGRNSQSYNAHVTYNARYRYQSRRPCYFVAVYERTF